MANHSLRMDLVPRQTTEPRLTTTLEHGIKPELVPDELNLVDRVIILSDVPYDIIALLFRDMGYDSHLTTKKEADRIGRTLVTSARRYDKDLVARLKELKIPEQVEDELVYVSGY